AFVRVPAAFDAMLFGPVRSARPWSIRVADCSTGKSAPVWRADEGEGSALHGIEGPTLLWAAGDRLVFPWEKDGWVHLYSLPVPRPGGAPAGDLPGDRRRAHPRAAVPPAGR